MKKSLLFLCGVGRSGTTALARFLNIHPRVVVGIERYKHRFLRHQQKDFNFTALFERARFFEDDEEDTNVRIVAFRRDYARALKKFDDAVYVGDKVPRLYSRLSFIRQKFEGCKIVYIVRDPVQVASSWQRRAGDDDDRWPKSNGFTAAVAEWNKSVRIVKKHRDEM